MAQESEEVGPVSAEPQDNLLLQRVEAAVGNLPRLQREVFLAHRLDGLSYREIGKRTGRSVRQVERVMAKALYKLVKHMDGERLRWWERWF
ncbi:hypothetical protein GCM10022281_14910 [Sphingomonas rosea]|uniref:RNA polymerase sigma factor 70 region 4 type 2 domain-containing protein n=1 Tax=Sphingomonas rosea TaxID=335605 RepID=A0ABP7U441_9SPHN